MQLNWNLFMQQTVTGYETWLHHYNPETIKYAVAACQFSKPSEVQGAEITWQNKMHCFLGC